MFLNKDYREMLTALNDAEADYLIVGAYALAFFRNIRATGDIDIWVRPTLENASKVWQALEAFEAPKSNLSPSEGVAVKDAVPVTNDVLRRRAGATNRLSEAGAHSTAIWPIGEDAQPHDAAREMIDHNRYPPTKRPTLWQGKGQPGTPQACASGHNCQID